VLSVVATGETFAVARKRANVALGYVHLGGSHFHSDIALRVAKRVARVLLPILLWLALGR